MVSRAVEDYLKTIYTLQQDGSSATTNAIAERMGLRAASVTSMLQQLSEQGLVEYRPYRGVHLTEAGLAAALRVIRRHRLIELYLNEELGVPWDRVHEEAERLEHAISPYLEERIDAKLGHPGFDPHGAPIPTSTGQLPVRDLVPLSDLPVNTPSIVRYVPDDDPELLRYAASLGLVPDACVSVLDRDPAASTISLAIGYQPETRETTRVHVISQDVAHSVFVSRPSSDQS
jgi:DtxR family Mn-dependent transcriptional regulator